MFMNMDLMIWIPRIFHEQFFTNLLIDLNRSTRRDFRFERFPPERCTETGMVGYLVDCYERVHLEEKKATKVDFFVIKLISGYF